MRASRLVTLALLVPAAALSQGAGPVDAARRAAATAGRAAQERAAAADAAYAGTQPPPRDDGKPPPAAAAEGAESAPSGAPESYTVRKGDTLWDLASRFQGSPWTWPQLWSHNPSIANPHLIYPGDLVRLRGGAAGVKGEAASDGELEASAPADLEDLTRADMKRPQQIGEGDEVEVVGPYKIGYVPRRGVYARRDSFVSERELASSGTITASFEEKLLLTLHDRAYVRFANPEAVQVGESYLVYKTERPVMHPVTRLLVGYQTTVIGTGRVIALDEKAATVEIAAAYEPIERGALVGVKARKLQAQVTFRPNERSVDGVIIASQRDLVTEIGEHHMVFLDKGKADGVEDGNVFTVVRSGDPYGKEMRLAMRDPLLPKEEIGRLVVVEVQQSSSAALVLQSKRELFVGDLVEMRTAVSPERTAALVR